MNLREKVEQQQSLLEFTGNPIEDVILRDGAFCSYCGQNRTRWTMDHVIPRSRAKGVRIPDNKVLCCHTCNVDKANSTPLEWLWEARHNQKLYWPWRQMEHERVAREVQALKVAEEKEWRDDIRQFHWGKLKDC